MAGRRAIGALVLLFVSVRLSDPGAPVFAQAAPARTAQIGFLGDAPPFLFDAFRHGLQDLGYIDGRNIAIVRRAPDWKTDRLPQLADELVRLKVDVIVASNTHANEAAKRATTSIPIVFAVSGDPVAEGLVARLARPGGNLTGLATISPELVGKQLEILKQIVPKVARVSILKNPMQPSHDTAVQQAEVAASALGIQLHVLGARTPSEIEAAFTTMSNQRAGGLLVLRDAEFRAHRAQIVALAARKRLPAMYGLREEAEAGGLVAYGASVPLMFRRAATYVDKILRGAKPAELPVEQPTKFELVINLKTAKSLGLTIPPSLLGQADQVIQ